MSAYVDDPRVVWSPDGVSSNVVAYLPGPRDGEGGRMVTADEDGFVVRGVVDEYLSIRHGWGTLRVFLTVDEAIRAVLDAPIGGKVAPQ